MERCKIIEDTSGKRRVKIESLSKQSSPGWIFDIRDKIESQKDLTYVRCVCGVHSPALGGRRVGPPSAHPVHTKPRRPRSERASAAECTECNGAPPTFLLDEPTSRAGSSNTSGAPELPFFATRLVTRHSVPNQGERMRAKLCRSRVKPNNAARCTRAVSDARRESPRW